MDVKIVSIIVGGIIGAVISFLGFQYKLRIDRIEKLNIALYRLMEVWVLIGTAKLIRSKNFIDKLSNEVIKSFPAEKIDETIKENIKEGMLLATPLLISIDKNESFLDKYSSSVSELASIYPIKAFEMNSNQFLMKYLKNIDALKNQEPDSQTNHIIIERLRDFALEDAFKEFENDLKYLAKKSGIWNYFFLLKRVSRIKQKIESIHEMEMSKNINKIIGPAIQAHYDSLGIKNPNLKTQT